MAYDLNQFHPITGRQIIEAGTTINIADSTGDTTDAAVTDPTASASIIAALKGLLTVGSSSGSFTTATISIALGASLSAYIDKRGYNKIAILMPSAWDAAGLSFAGCSTSGGTYVPIYAEDGIELTASASTDRIVTIGINESALAPIPYLKIRSGTVGVPVVQTVARSLIVMLQR
jgi:hypothetical protein